MRSHPIIFLLFILIAFFLLNWVIYFPIVRAYKPSRKTRGLIILVLLVLTFVLVWGELLKRIWGVYWLSLIGNIWLGVLAILFTLMVINLLILLIIPKISRYSTTLLLFLAVFLSIVSYYNNLRPPQIIEYDIYSDKISEDADPFKIVLTSEFHLMSNTNIKRLERNLIAINRLDPDAIIIAGDLIDEPYDKLKHLAPYFYTLNPQLGIYAVPGNHDYYSKIGSYYSFTQDAGIINLLNDNIYITEDIILAGVTDRTASIDPPDVEKAMKGIDTDKYIIFISHQPLYYKEAISYSADLILGGHTHRGQIPPLSFFIGLFFRYPYGLYEENGVSIYTTSGIDTWGPPMRLFSRNEIAVFNIYPQK
ncbi:MAG: metallophosphoesterase [Candidatus Cloacimonetes bacterium]|nr:metallophosphoesterase [Candidatus Cloacimonadota bacterium]